MYLSFVCIEYQYFCRKDKGTANSVLGALVKLIIKENYYYKMILFLTLLSINYTISMH